jgi:N-acetylneuraminate synthase
VGSGEVSNPLLLKAMARTGWPILLSSGMSDWKELTEAVKRIEALDVDVGLLQCTSKYPTPLSEVGLNVLDQMRRRFGTAVGLSDHSGQIYPGLAAMARGADMLEVHVVLSRDAFGPDTPASVSVGELKLLAEARDAFHVMRQNPVDKDAFAQEFGAMRRLFNKSVSLRSAQTAGTTLTRDMLTVKKPGSGIPAESLEACEGRRLAVDVGADRVLNWEDLESS